MNKKVENYSHIKKTVCIEIGPIQMTSNTADNEQMNRSETDPPIMPITEQVALAAGKSIVSFASE